jgi:ring-1,2-phenylacetyl-CoA epoxidase subunit PaaC
MIKEYILQQADNALILGQRLGEWCGHGPILEQDIALTNISLDQIGLARNLYTYLAELEGGGATEDDYPFKRDVFDFYNLLLLEQPNTDFAYTIVRQFLYDSFAIEFYQALSESSDERLAALAEKSLKEIKYHFKYSSEWMIRLGDGTEVSHQKIQTALNDLWMYSQECFEISPADEWAVKEGVGVDLNLIRDGVNTRRSEVIKEATLEEPTASWFQTGGKKGVHSEHLGFILADLQYYQRAYPDSVW